MQPLDQKVCDNSQPRKLHILMDTTGSMGTAFDAVRDSIIRSYQYLDLLKIGLVVILYGDYNHQLITIKKVTTIIDSSEPNFLQRLKDYRLCDNGGGGDTVEALNTALHVMLEREQHNQSENFLKGCVIIADACGDTNKSSRCNQQPLDHWLPDKRFDAVIDDGCRTCGAESLSRNMERKCLRAKGIAEQDCNFYHFMDEMKKNHFVASLIKNIQCLPDSMYQTTGGIVINVPLTEKTSVTAALFTIISNYLGMRPSEQKTPVVIPGIESIHWSQDMVDRFRQYVCEDPWVLEYLSPFATIYYRSINILAKRPTVEGKENSEKNMNAHSAFMKYLRDKNINDTIIDIFKNAQSELLKKPLSELQDSTDRIYVHGPQMLLSKFSEILSFTSRDRDAMDQLKQVIEQIKFTTSDTEMKDGISLSMIRDNPLNLISYIGREHGYYIPVSKSLGPIFYAAIMKWSEIKELRDIVLAKINDPEFLDSDLILRHPTSYNMGYLLFIWRTFKKLIPKKSNNIFKLWRLCNLASILQKSITCECVMDSSRMDKAMLLQCATGVSMAFDVALQLWYPACIFVPCDEQKVIEIINTMQFYPEIYHRDHCESLLQLVKEFKIIYLSTYACNFYKQYVNGAETKELDKYMTTSFVEIQKDLTEGPIEGPIRDQYLRYIGYNGELIFNTLIPLDSIKPFGAKNIICSNNNCRKIYAVADSTTSPTRRCVECRTQTRHCGDRAPGDRIESKVIRCTVGHEFISGVVFSLGVMIPKDKCPLCNVCVEMLNVSRTVQVTNFFKENLKFSAKYMQIDPPELLSALMTQNSAYKTVMIDTTDSGKGEGKVINQDFVKWNPMIGGEHEDDGSVLRIDGLPLTDESRNSILQLLKNNLMIECNICTSMKYISYFKNVCTNPCCVGEICMDCVTQQHSFAPDFTGKISCSKLVCTFCRSPIDPNSKAITSTITRLLCRKGKVILSNPDTGKTYGSGVEALMAGEDVRKCTETKCLDPTGLGFFMAPKNQCGAMEAEEAPLQENTQSLCPACNDAKAQNQSYLSEWTNLGFTVIGDTILRQCPGCGEGVYRHNGCAHITCRCGQNFCYGCGESFQSGNETYNHLSTAFGYGNYWPTDEQIKEHIKNPGVRCTVNNNNDDEYTTDEDEI
jgi:hypothetical protein